MNTNSGRLKGIFDQQKELMKKYHQIEIDNGLCTDPRVPVDIQDKFGQAQLRDFAWRVTEELTEAHDSLGPGEGTSREYREELVDCLHFYIELLIISGLDYPVFIQEYSIKFLSSYELIPSKYDFLSAMAEEVILDYTLDKSTSIDNFLTDSYTISRDIIQCLGMAMNTLKNRAWSKKVRKTAVPFYNSHLITGFRQLLLLLLRSGMSAQETYDEYVRKRVINQTRQENNY